VIPAKAVVTSAGGPYAWTVQLAAFRTPARTEIGWKILHGVAPEVLAPLEQFVRNPNPKFKWDRLFRLRTYAFETRGPADEVCARVKARNLECLVVRTQRLPGLLMVSQSRVAQADPKVDLNRSTRTGATAHVTTKGTPKSVSRKSVSRRTEPPVGRTAKAPTAAGDVMKTAVERQRSATTTRTAKRRASHAAYQVQLAVYRTAKRAQRGWRELRHSPPDVLGKLGHAIKQTGILKSGTRLYRLRTLAFADRSPARALCAKLKRRDIECIVVSTPDHAGLIYEPSEFEKANAPPPAPQPKASVKHVSNQRHADAGWPKNFNAF
jgi:hypothetical protein